MTSQERTVVKQGAKLGALSGGIFFLIFCPLTALYFGGCAALAVSEKLLSNVTGMHIVSSLAAGLAVAVVAVLSVAVGTGMGATAAYLISKYATTAPNLGEKTTG